MRQSWVGGLFAIVLLASVIPAHAQQRPLVTEDPESIGAGRVLIEAGMEYLRAQTYPVSGLEGNLLRFPTFGVSVGISSIAELQIDGGLRDSLSITKREPAPLSDELTATSMKTTDVEDFVVGTKVRFASETARRPAFGARFATRLPNAGNESGLGLDTMDFYASLLVGKTVQSVRVVGNVGLGILADPTKGDRQNDVLTYGISVARALTTAAELVGELNGRANTRSTPAFPGTESRGVLRFGGRYTRGPARLDAGVVFGLTDIDPSMGFTVGVTYVFNGFRVP